jgi:hypothetical protein
MLSKKKKACYWCGSLATNREHTPPKNLFTEQHKVNLVTVPSCSEHHNRFSQSDEKVRFYIQGRATNSLACGAFRDKTLRGLERPQASSFRDEFTESTVILQDPDGQTLQFLTNVRGALLTPYFEKITRSLYFTRFGQPSMTREARYYTRSFYDPNDEEVLVMMEGGFRDNESQIGISAHPEIFQWRSVTLNRAAFVAEMTFYQGVVVYGLIKLV